ncbi:MAG: SEC-C metal-binding domain-containing protein [Christensenella sp.]
MALYEQWQDLAQMAQTPAQQQAFWDEYFAMETDVYKQILSDTSVAYAGTVKEVAEKVGMEPVIFSGFIDGINSSLKKEIDVDKITEDTNVALDVDFEKLFFNMNDAKAKWLYTLPEWDNVLTEKKREEITHEWRLSKQAVSEKTVGRNDPCPCGSGKKYKKCCGKNA